MSDTQYQIASLSETQKAEITQLENEFKEKTGKECVMIAWEKQ